MRYNIYSGANHMPWDQYQNLLKTLVNNINILHLVLVRFYKFYRIEVLFENVSNRLRKTSVLLFIGHITTRKRSFFGILCYQKSPITLSAFPFVKVSKTLVFPCRCSLAAILNITRELHSQSMTKYVQTIRRHTYTLEKR